MDWRTLRLMSESISLFKKYPPTGNSDWLLFSLEVKLRNKTDFSFRMWTKWSLTAEPALWELTDREFPSQKSNSRLVMVLIKPLLILALRTRVGNTGSEMTTLNHCWLSYGNRVTFDFFSRSKNCTNLFAFHSHGCNWQWRYCSYMGLSTVNYHAQ